MPESRDNGLPPKEAALFKSIVKHYETKQYKKGAKAADQVLKRFADHGETLAMKGLILNCQERKTEAYELVRRGVKQDIKSHVCWHVYGLLYRSDRDYMQAIKCYRGALRHDPDNIQILRDLSLLQVQMRDLPGFVQTRQHLLTLKPTNRNNWFTFAVAQHLMGNVRQAVGIVDAYERTLEGTPDNEYEHSEMLLYKNLMLEEEGLRQAALDHLHEQKESICDLLWSDASASEPA
jgi:peptide alpha-N-acetyltransferase